LAADYDDLMLKLVNRELFIVERSEVEALDQEIQYWKKNYCPTIDTSQFGTFGGNRTQVRETLINRWNSKRKPVLTKWEAFRPPTRSNYYQEMKRIINDRLQWCLGIDLTKFVAYFLSSEKKALGPTKLLEAIPIINTIHQESFPDIMKELVQLGIDFAQISMKKFQILKKIWRLLHFPGTAKLAEVKKTMNVAIQALFNIVVVDAIVGVKCCVEKLLTYIVNQASEHLGHNSQEKLTVKLTADGFSPSRQKEFLMFAFVPVTKIAQQSPWHTFPAFMGECEESAGNVTFLKELFGRQLEKLSSGLKSVINFIACMDLKCAWLMFNICWPKKFTPKEYSKEGPAPKESTPSPKKKRTGEGSATAADDGDQGSQPLVSHSIEFCPHCHCPANEAHWFHKWKDPLELPEVPGASLEA
jgi:hypothetical protein